MLGKKIKRDYVSPIDHFLNRFDETHPKLTRSQKKEIAKYQRIYALRDNPDQSDENKLPEWF